MGAVRSTAGTDHHFAPAVHVSRDEGDRDDARKVQSGWTIFSMLRLLRHTCSNSRHSCARRMPRFSSPGKTQRPGIASGLLFGPRQGIPLNIRFPANIPDQPAVRQSDNGIGSTAEAAIGVDQFFCDAPLRQQLSILVTVLRIGFAHSVRHHRAPRSSWHMACDGRPPLDQRASPGAPTKASPYRHHPMIAVDPGTLLMF